MLDEGEVLEPCPEPNTVTYCGLPQEPTGETGFVFVSAACQGDTGYNGFYGKGIVDALKAVTYYHNPTGP